MNSCMSPLLLVFPSFVVPRIFSHGLAKEVSSVQLFVTHRAGLSAEPWEVSSQTGSATAHALRDSVFRKSTRDVPMFDIFRFHFQRSHLFQ